MSKLYLKTQIFYFIFSLLIFPILIQPLPVFAQTTTTILPVPESGCITPSDCSNNDGCRKNQILYLKDPEQIGKELGCKIVWGVVTLKDIPYLIKHLIEFALAIAGTICMLFIVIGGYYYAFGGVTGDQEKGKKTITSAITGLIVVMLAWGIVNVVMYIVTY